MKKTEAHAGTMEAQLTQWGATLDELLARAEAAGTDAKHELRQRVTELKARHQVARQKLAELKAAGSDEWDTLKAGVEGTWKELESALAKLTSA